jgi:hypothetical protein
MGMNKQFALLGILILFVCIRFSGCFEYDTQSTTLTPARDVTGQWSGAPVFTDRANECKYDGTMTLTLQQNGDVVTGYFDLTVTSSEGNPSCVMIGSSFRYLVEGTISSTQITLVIADTDRLLGSFTTDLMTLRWEQCADCDSGPAIKLIGMVSLVREK